jgi:hypothetical protein
MVRTTIARVKYVLKRRYAAAQAVTGRATGISRVQVAANHSDGDPKDPMTPAVIRYWETKNARPDYHAGRHGGRRWAKLPLHLELFVRRQIWVAVKRTKSVNFALIALHISRLATSFARSRHLNAPRVTVSPFYVRRIFKSWNWSPRVPVVVHINKFRPSNLLRYVHYSTAITQIDPRRLKFVDEAMYVSRGTQFELWSLTLILSHCFPFSNNSYFQTYSFISIL